MHLGGEILGRKRFVEEMDILLQYSPARNDLSRITGHEHRLDFRQDSAESSCQLATVHFRHDNVGNQQVNPAGMYFGEPERFRRRVGGQDGVAQGLQV